MTFPVKVVVCLIVFQEIWQLGHYLFILLVCSKIMLYYYQLPAFPFFAGIAISVVLATFSDNTSTISRL